MLHFVRETQGDPGNNNIRNERVYLPHQHSFTAIFYTTSSHFDGGFTPVNITSLLPGQFGYLMYNVQVRWNQGFSLGFGFLGYASFF